MQSLDELLPPEMRRRRVPPVDLPALYPHLSPQQLGVEAGGGGASGTTGTTSSSGSGDGGTWNVSSGVGGGGCGGAATGGSS